MHFEGRSHDTLWCTARIICAGNKREDKLAKAINRVKENR